MVDGKAKRSSWDTSDCSSCELNCPSLRKKRERLGHPPGSGQRNTPFKPKKAWMGHLPIISTDEHPQPSQKTRKAGPPAVLKHRQDTFVLDTAFVLIEGHPAGHEGNVSEKPGGGSEGERFPGSEIPILARKNRGTFRLSPGFPRFPRFPSPGFRPGFRLSPGFIEGNYTPSIPSQPWNGFPVWSTVATESCN